MLTLIFLFSILFIDQQLLSTVFALASYNNGRQIVVVKITDK